MPSGATQPASRQRRERRLIRNRDRLVHYWVPVVVWAAVIFTLSSIPRLNSGLGFWDQLLRKLAHGGEFALLAALLLRALARPWPAFAIAIAYAASDELHQHFVSGRVGSPWDIAIDATGALLGLLAFVYGRRRLEARQAGQAGAAGE